MRGVRRVANENDIAVKPPCIAHARELRPGRRHTVRRVAHEAMLAKPLGEHRFAGGDGGIGVHAIEPGRAPRRLVALDDERGHAIVEAVAVRLEDAVRVLHDEECECVERQRCTEPDEARGTNVEVGLERQREFGPDGAVDAIGSDNHVRVGEAKRHEIGECAHV